MGGTNTAFGVVDAQGRVVARGSIKTAENNGFDDYVDQLHTAIMRTIDEAGLADQVGGMGFGAPNANYYTGIIEAGVNLPWPTPIPLADKISAKFGIPCQVTNDANAAAVGEMTYGVARGMKDFIMITLGTGVGSGIVVNGKVLYGYDGFAGELGHVIINRENGRQCGCGRKGCLETYCSATGVARTAREFLAQRGDESVLRGIDADSLTSKDVHDAAVAGDKLSQDVFEFTGKVLGEALADFTAFSAPEAFVLFGGLTKSGDFIMNPIKQSFEQNVLSLWRGKVKILFSAMNEADAAILGASALGWQND